MVQTPSRDPNPRFVLGVVGMDYRPDEFPCLQGLWPCQLPAWNLWYDRDDSWSIATPECAVAAPRTRVSQRQKVDQTCRVGTLAQNIWKGGGGLGHSDDCLRHHVVGTTRRPNQIPARLRCRMRGCTVVADCGHFLRQEDL